MAKVTTGFCPCSSFLGSLSKQFRMLCSDPRDITQNPFDCPFARFSKNFTSMKSVTPRCCTVWHMS